MCIAIFDPDDACERVRRRVDGLRGTLAERSAAAFAQFEAFACAPLECNSVLRAAESVCPALRPGLLSPDDVDQIIASAAALEAELGPLGMRREGAKLWYGPAHSVLFMHTDGWFADKLPTLHERLTGAMRTQQASWCLRCTSSPMFPPGPRALSVRCIELHTYGVGGSLSRPGHRDSGSCIVRALEAAMRRESHAPLSWRTQARPPGP